MVQLLEVVLRLALQWARSTGWGHGKLSLKGGGWCGAGGEVGQDTAPPEHAPEAVRALAERYRGKYVPHSCEEPPRSDSMPIQGIKNGSLWDEGRRGHWQEPREGRACLVELEKLLVLRHALTVLLGRARSLLHQARRVGAACTARQGETPEQRAPGMPVACPNAAGHCANPRSLGPPFPRAVLAARPAMHLLDFLLCRPSRPPQISMLPPRMCSTRWRKST